MTGSNSPDALLLSAADGSVLPDFPEINGMITAAAGDGAGGWYIAGGFSRINGHERQGLAHILADGRLNEAWAPGLKGTAMCLFIHENMLYVGGVFLAVNGIDRINLARIRLSDGTLDENWAPAVEGARHNILQAMATDGEFIYLGGRFTSVNGRDISHAARISLENGLLDEEWRPDPGHEVTALLLHEEYLFLSGYFSIIGGEERSRLAKLHKTSAGVVETWESDHEIRAAHRMAAHGDFLYVGGSRVWDDASRAYIPYSGLNRFSITSGNWDDTWMHGIDKDIDALSLSKESLYVGAFGGIALKNEKAGFMPAREKLVDWEQFVLIYKIELGSGTMDPDFSPPNIWGNVFYLHADEDQLLAGGWFILRDPEPMYGIGRFDKELGTHDKDWVPEVSSFVSSIIIEDETLYAALAMDFSSLDKKPELHYPVVAKLSTAHASLDESWGPDIQGGTVAMVADEDALYLGGHYADMEENTISALQKINKSDGQATTGWGPMIRGSVFSMDIHEGWLYLGGEFTIDGYPTINNLARIRLADGMPDESWTPRTNNLVYSSLLHGEYVYAAGEFTSVGHKSIRYLGRIHRQSGEVDTQWNPDPNHAVYSIQRINQDIIAGGIFTQIGQKDQAHFARLDTETGQLNADWSIKLGWLVDDYDNPSSIQKLQVLEQELLIGGYFFYVNDQAKLLLARLDIPMPGIESQPLDQHVCDGTDVVFSIEASPGEGELSLQWQQFADEAWEDIPEATGTTLEIREASSGQDGSMFRCLVSGLNGELISETAQLFVNPLYEFEEEKEICADEVYQWQGLELSEAGTYRVEYLSMHGCDSIYVLDLQVFEVDNAISREGRMLTANAQEATYQWVECHNDYAPIAGATQRSFTVESDGSYAVIVTQNQCSLMSECVEVSLVGITDPESAESLWIYPNPSTGKLQLAFSIPMDNARIDIFDTTGKTVFTLSAFSGQRMELDLSALPAGTFILQVTDGHRQFNRIFLKGE